VGDIIDYEDEKLMVTGWDVPPWNENLEPESDKKFVLVNVVILNTGVHEKLNVNPIFTMKLQDSSGKQYEPDEQCIYGNYGCVPFQNGVIPGQSTNGTVLFYVDANSSEYVFVYNRNPLSGDIVQVDLGKQPVTLSPPPELLNPYPDARSIGDIASKGDFMLVVLGWSLLPENGTLIPKEGYKFVLVDALVVNEGNQKLKFSPYYIKLRDNIGHLYDGEFYCTQGECAGFHELIPGQSTRDKILFQVLETSDGYVFVFDANPPVSDNIYVLLGENPVSLKPPAELLNPYPGAHKVGEAISCGDLTLTVLGWGLPQTTQDTEPDPGNKFLVVDILLANHGNVMAKVNPRIDAIIHDADDMAYRADFGHYYGENESDPFEDGIAPGEQKRGYVVYQVPQTSNSYVLAYDTSFAFFPAEGENIYIHLGEEPVGLESML
jgi:hypothetical protein